MRSRGISEGIKWVYNALPNVTDAEILAGAGLDDLLQPSRLSPFEWVWRYGSGLQTETVEIAPGEFLPLRESEAQEFERATNALEMGLCIVNVNDPNHPETKKAALQALARASRFYFEGGQKQLLHQRKLHNYTEQDMLDQRTRFSAYYINKMKERVVQEHIAKLKAPAAKGKAA